METHRMMEQSQSMTPGRDESKPKGKTREELAEERKAKAERDLALIKARKNFRNSKDGLREAMNVAVASKSRNRAAAVLAEFNNAYTELMDLEIPEQ